jgi:hypothetical protein
LRNEEKKKVRYDVRCFMWLGPSVIPMLAGVDSLIFLFSTRFRAHVHPVDVYECFNAAKGVMDLSPVP